MNVREVYAKAVAETASLFERRAEFTDEDFDIQLELLKDPIYCPICGSCGEPGCCSPGNCEQVRGLYCDSNVESYHELQEAYNKMYDAIDKLICEWVAEAEFLSENSVGSDIPVGKTYGECAEQLKKVLEV